MPENQDAAAVELAVLDVLVLGELNPDVLVAGVDANVRFGQVESQVPGATLRLGSSGAITAAACRSMGLSTALCAVIGDDPLGRLTLELLAETGIDPATVIVRGDVETGMTVVLSTTDGDRALLTHTGAMSALRVDDVPPALLARARHVHVSSLYLQRGLQPGLAELFAGLVARGVTTSVDPGWDPDEKWTDVVPLLPYLTYLLPNAAELAGIATAAGLPAGAGDPDTALIRSARGLAALGPAVVVKRGGRGAVFVTADQDWIHESEPLTPVDTTGAGDNFDAGVLWALARGHDEPGCLVAGTTAGATNIGGIGGTSRMATSDVLAAAVRESRTPREETGTS